MPLLRTRLPLPSRAFDMPLARLTWRTPTSKTKGLRLRLASSGQSAEEDSDGREPDGSKQHPPKRTVETLPPCLKGAEFPFAPFSLHDEPLPSIPFGMLNVLRVPLVPGRWPTNETPRWGSSSWFVVGS